MATSIRPHRDRNGDTHLRASARGAFVLSGRNCARRRTHLPANVQTVWRHGRFLYAEASTRCRRILSTACVLMDAPDGFELCDDCILADFPVFCVYRMYDAAGNLLYIGSTKDLPVRLRSHAFGQRPSPWWPLVDRWTYDTYATHEEALAVEAREIVTGQPLFNVDLTNRTKVPGRRPTAFVHLARTATARRAFANTT